MEQSCFMSQLIAADLVTIILCVLEICQFTTKSIRNLNLCVQTIQR